LFATSRLEVPVSKRDVSQKETHLPKSHG